MRRALVALVCISACRGLDVVPFDVNAEPGELVIAAVVSADGELLRVAGVVHDRSLLSIPVEPDATLYSWTLGRNDLLGADGQPLDPRAVTITMSESRGGSCGRCLAPSDQPPQMLHPGASCTLAAFPRALRYTQAGGGEPAPEIDPAIRKKIRLELAGECPCPSEQLVEQPALFTWRRIAPDTSSLPHQTVTVGNDGTIAMISDDHAATVDLAGKRTIREGELGFAGPVIDATGIGDGRYLVYTYHRAAGTPNPFVVLGPELELLGDTLLLDHHPSRMRTIGDRAWLAGRKQSVSAMEILACRSGLDGGVTCGPLSPPISGDSFFRDVVLAENGTLLAIGGATGFAYARRAAPGVGVLDPHDATVSWQWVLDEYLGDLRPRTLGGVELEAFNELAMVGGQMYLCARSEIPAPDLPATVHVLTASIPIDLSGAAIAWRKIWSAIGARCDGFAVLSDGSLLLSVGSLRGASIRGDVAIDVNPAAVLGIAPRTVRSLADKVALTADGAVFRISAAAERIDGPAIWSPIRVEKVLADPDGFTAIATPGFVQKIRYEDQTLVAEVARPLAGFAASDVITRAARDSTDGALIIAGHEAGGAPFLRRVGDGGFEAIVLPAGARVVLDLVEVAPRNFAMISGDGRVLWLEDGMVVEVPAPALDDVSECRLRRFFDPSTGPLRAIDAAGGVAWAAGCEGTILRITKTRAERISLEDRSAHLTAVRALCADHVLVGSSSIEDPLRGIGRVFEVHSTGDAFAIRDHAGLADTAPINALDSGAMVELIGDGRALTAVFGSFSSLSTVSRFLDAGLRPHFAADLRAAATDARGTIIVAGAHGLLIAASPP